MAAPRKNVKVSHLDAIYDAIKQFEELEKADRVDHRDHGKECGGEMSWKSEMGRDIAKIIRELEAKL